MRFHLPFVLVVLTMIMIPCFGQKLPATNAGITVSGPDQQAILRDIYEYSYRFDSRDLQGFLSLFTEDAVWEASYVGNTMPAISVISKEQLRQVIFSQMQNQIAAGIQCQHFQTNTVLTRLSSDRVQAVSMIMVTWQPGAQPGTMVHTGFHRDEYIRQGATGEFVRCQAYVDDPAPE